MLDIIDSHTHVDEFEAFGWYDPPQTIVDLLDKAGIRKAVIMTYCDTPVLKEDGLDYIAQAVKKYPDRLIGYARLHPQVKGKAIALLEEAVLDMNFKGLKMHPESLTTHPYHEASLALIRKAGELRIPTLFHCGDESMSLPLQIARAAELCPESKIILGHMGGYFHLDDAIRMAEKYENLILETSATPYPDKIREAVKRIGAHRVLYASDGPGCNPALEVKKIEHAGLSDSEMRLVMGENILQLLEQAKTR
jgi:predicted TIM-barrel fold metal-dependent hydrolase